MLSVTDIMEPASVHPSVRPFTLSNIKISETSRLINIKFHLEHYLGIGKAALGFWPIWIRTLVFMASYSCRVIIGKSCDLSFAFIFDWIVFILTGNEYNCNILNGSEIQQDSTWDCGVNCS